MFAIDVHALLTGGGRGEYTETTLNRNMLPKTVMPGQQPHAVRSISPLTDEVEKRLSVLEFHRQILVEVARISLLARDLRQEASERGDHPVNDDERNRRMHRVDQARASLLQVWNTSIPILVAMGKTNDDVPVKDRGIFEHVSQNLLVQDAVNLDALSIRSVIPRSIISVILEN